MTDNNFIKNPKFHTWVKGGLCLRYLKDGLCDLVTKVMNKQHEEIRIDIGITPETICNTCELKSLKPHPCIPGPTPGCPEGNQNCTCKRKEYKECPNKVCDRMKKAIIESEESGHPNWKNIDITRCHTSPWEIQKCFIKAPGYDENKSADETDAAGLLLLISHNKYFRSFMSCPTSHLKKIRDWRGSVLFHSGNMELEEQQLKSVIEDIKAVLQDEKELKSMECAKQALCNLEELETGRLKITFEHKTDVIDDSIDSIRNELKELDSRIEELQKDKACLQLLEERVTELENLIKEKDGLIKLEKEQQALLKNLKKIEDRKELRHSLAAFLGKNYVTTSACPLKPQKNVINISDVYVQPYLEIKEEENEGQTNETIKTPVTSYNELFERNNTRSKRILILGDVGSGKSAFCQMLIHNWVKSVNEYCDIKENQVNATGVCTMMSSSKIGENMPAKSTTSYDDMKEMLKFNYLFYIPLRSRLISGKANIRKMIQKCYKREVPSKEVLKDVLQNWPEQCLIIADGIDEWSPGQRDKTPEHETYGLPNAGDMKQATILMTSRPSSPGILAMKSSDSDQIIFLQGIKNTKELAEKYYAKLKEKAKGIVTIETILNGLKTIQIRDLDKSPLLLKYIVWLLFIGSEVGSTVSEVYCNVLNILLRWNERKSTQNQSTDDNQCIQMTDSNENFKHLRLPKLVEKHPSCKNKSMLIFTLGKIAFESLIQSKCSEMAFGRYTLMQNGINEELIQILLQTGLLTEENRFDPTEEDTQFSFINISFLEYFAALFIASHPDVQTDVLTDKTKSSDFKDVLYHLFRTFCLEDDILQLENVLVLASGLSPHMLHEICRNIYKTPVKVNDDLESFEEPHSIKAMINYAHRYSTFCYDWEGKRKFTDVQDLVFNCLSESRSNNKSFDLQVPLDTITINDDNVLDIHNKCFQIDPLTVLHLFVFCRKLEDMSFIDKFNNLRTINVYRSKLLHNTLTLLCKLVSRTCSLRIINIKGIECHEHKKEHRHHVMDLSLHSKLQQICCKSAEILRLEHINTSNLEDCETDRIHILGQVMLCKNLKTLILSGLHLKVANLSNLLKFISRATYLRTLDLYCIVCKDILFEGPRIDLSNHYHLQTLKVNDCFKFHFTNISESELEICETNNNDLKRLLQNSKTFEMSTCDDPEYNKYTKYTFRRKEEQSIMNKA